MTGELLTDANLDRIESVCEPGQTIGTYAARALIVELRHARNVIRRMIDHGEFPFYDLDYVRQCARADDPDGQSLMPDEANDILRAIGECP